MTKLVTDNTTPEGRQRQLEAKVQVAFAKAAGNLLRALSGTPDVDLREPLREYLAVHEAAEHQSIDPEGVVIRMPKLDRGESDEDEHINAILRGSLRMVAAMLYLLAKVPVDNRGGEEPRHDEMEAYNAAKEEIVRGVTLLQERVRQTKRSRRGVRR